MKKAFILSVVLLFFLVVGPTELQAQCAMCKAVLESNMQSGEDAMGKGINGGIMYIMFVPYILLGVAGYFTFRHVKKLNSAEAE